MPETQQTKKIAHYYSEWMGWATLITFSALVIYGLSISSTCELELREAITIGTHSEYSKHIEKSQISVNP